MSRRARRSVLLTLLVLVACKRKDPPPPAPGDAAASDAGAIASSAPPPPPPPLPPPVVEGADLRALLCGDRGPVQCRLANEVPAGAGRIAASLVIRDPSDDGGTDDPFDSGEDVETWLVEKTSTGYRRVQFLVKRVVRPRGAPWDKTAVALKGGVLHLDLSGGDVPSTWAGNESIDVAFDPPRVSKASSFYYNRLQPCPSSKEEATADGFVKTVQWRAAKCEGPQPPCGATFEYLAVPRLKLPPAFEADGWKTTDLDACAAVVDGTAPRRGFVTFGKSSGATDAELRVVLSDTRTLYVEVRDDHFTETTKPKGWVKADHLEVWSTRSAASYMDACSTDKPTQWGISLSDAAPEGGVYVGVRGTDEGKPDARSLPVVQRAITPTVVRLQIRLPPWPKEEDLEGLTVAYSDSDDGTTQKSIIATSKLVFGRYETLSHVERVSAVCEVAAGKLRPRHASTPDKPLYPVDMP